MFIVLLSTKPKQQSGSTFVPAPFEPCTFHSVICVVEFVCFCVNSCWSLCVRRRCFSSSFLFHHHHHALFTIFPLPGARPLPIFPQPWCTPSPYHSFPSWRPPPLPHFGKFWAKGKVSRKEKKGKVPIYSKQKRQGANVLNKKKKKKERKSRTIQGNRITFVRQALPLLGATSPPSLFWDLVQYSSLFQIV